MSEHIENLMDDLLTDYSGFVIENDNTADWALRKVKEYNDEYERIAAIADERIRELQEKKRKLAERREMKVNYFTTHLQMYFETVPHASTKTQETYKLLSGRLVLKRQAPEYKRDETAMVAWAKDNAPVYVQVKESVAWGELKKATETQGDKVIYKDTGEVVPGVVAVERPDVFEVVV